MNKFLLLISLSFTLLSAKQIEVGSLLNQMNNFKYETPHGREVIVPKSPKLIIIAFEKDTAALVNEYLDTKSQYYLPENRSVFIADIHKMPTFIAKIFALPKLKKYKHPIYLHYNDKFHTFIPGRKEKVTLLHVENFKVINISFISTEEELKAAIER